MINGNYSYTGHITSSNRLLITVTMTTVTAAAIAARQAQTDDLLERIHRESIASDKQKKAYAIKDLKAKVMGPKQARWK